MKRVFLSGLSILIFLSCQPKESSQKLVAPTDNEKIVRQYFEHFNQHDWIKMAAMYIDTADFKDPSLGEGIVKQSRAETIKKYGELAQMIPDVKDSIVSIYPSGDKHVIVEFISTGTAPDKSRFALPICTIFTIENGLISKDFTYYDNFSE